MKILLVLAVLVLSAMSAYSQKFTVIDSSNKQALEAVTVYTKSGSFQTITDSKGQFTLTESVDSDDTLILRRLGYMPLEIGIKELLARESKTIALQETGISLSDVHIVASRWEQPEREMAQTSIEVSSEQIARNNPQTSADLLGQSGTVFIQKSQQGGGSPMIRGFATNRVLITVDQVRMNNAIFRSGNIQNVISIDPASIDKVEVLFGPGSLLYGSDAIGGVMGFYTLKPEFTDSISTKSQLNLRRATANNETAVHYHSQIGNKKWAWVGSLSLNHFDDLHMGTFGPAEYLNNYYIERVNGNDLVRINPDRLEQRNTGYSQFNTLQKLAYLLNDHTVLTYAFHHSETSNYGRYDRLIRERNGDPVSAQWFYGPQVWTMNHLNLNHTHERALFDQLNVNLAAQHFEESRNDRDLFDTIKNVRQEKVNALSANLDFGKSFGTRHKLTYGGEAIFNKVESNGLSLNLANSSITDAAPRYPEAKWATAGLYGNYKFKLSMSSLLEAGLRYSWFDLRAVFDTRFYDIAIANIQNQNSTLTGSIGYVFSPNNSLKLSTHASTGFRAPNVDDVGKVFDSEPGAVVVPNVTLQPEYAYNADLGLVYIFRKVVRLDASFFYTHLDNAMVRRDFTWNGQDSIVYDGELSRVQAIQNAGVARVYGGMLSLEYRSHVGLVLKSTASYQYGEEELDDGSFTRLRHAAPWFGRTSIGYEHKKIDWELYAHYSGGFDADELPFGERGKTHIYAIDENGRPYSPGWSTYNFRMGYQVDNSVSIRIALENITDRRYRTYSSGLVSAGRNIILSAQMNF